MRMTRHLFPIAVVAGALLAPALAPATTPRTKAAPTASTAVRKPASPSTGAAQAKKASAAKKIAATKNAARAKAAAPALAKAPAPAPAHEPAPAPAPVRGLAPASAGMVVAIDPETGALGMPTTEQMQSLMVPLDPAIDDSDVGLVQVFHPNGAVSIDLQGRFQEYAVVRIAPNGHKVFDCVPTRKAVARLLTVPAPATALEEK